MTANETTLVVGPIGARPWLTMVELVRTLEQLGNTVVVNEASDPVLPTPPALQRGLVRLGYSWLVWRRRARRSLRRADVNRILVWDPVMTIVCRAARPRGVRIVWATPAASPNRRERVVHALARRCADRSVAAPVVLPAATGPVVEGWVVFGTTGRVAEEVITRLRDRAADAAATAVVFDARHPATLSASDVARVVDAARPLSVFWCSENEWVARLGGIPALAIDLAADFVPDHRHAVVLAAGGTVLRASGDEWVTVSSADIGATLDDERQWAAVALT